MNKLSFFLFVLIVAMAACEKSGSDNNTPVLDGKNCKILTMSSTMTGYSSFAWQYYDSSGNLLYAKSVNSSGDTTIGPQYKYQGNILQYSFFGNNINFSDTVFYFFNGTNKLESTIEHNRTSSTLLCTTTNFFYNSAGQAIHTLARSTMDTIFSKVDSTIYTYTGNNVTRYTLFERTGYGSVFSVTIDISYDSMKNFYKVMGMPPDAFYFWSENNMTQAKFADSTNALTTFIYSKYNESGYPTEFTQTDNYGSQGPTTVVMTYQCH
jgi:hypothetical protein